MAGLGKTRPPVERPGPGSDPHLTRRGLQGLLAGLRMRTRLLGLGLIAVAMAAVPAVLHWREVQRGIDQAALAAQGIEPLRRVLELVHVTRQHRGLAALALAGDAGALAARAAWQGRVEAAFAGAGPLLERRIVDDRMRADWLQARAAWSALQQALAREQATAAQSLARHDELVERLAVVVDRLAHRFALTIEPEHDTQLLVEAAVRNLPALAEALGRARGRGAALLAAGQASDLDTLAVHGEAARSLQARLLLHLQELPTLRPMVWARLAGPLQDVRAKVEAAWRGVDGMRHGPLPADAARRHFDTFTAAIDALSRLDGVILDELQGLLDERVQARQQTAAAMLAGMLALLALGVWLGLRVGRSVTGQIGAEPADIVALTEAVADGRFDVDIPVPPGAQRSILAALANMQGALRTSERRHAELIEHMPMGVLIVRGRQIRLANAMAVQMRGCRADAVVGDCLADWVHDGDRARVQALLAGPAAAVPGPQLADVWCHRADGERRRWRMRAQPIQWEGHDARLVTLGDITEQTLAEQHARELASIVEQTSDAIMLTSADGTIRYINPGFERLSGYRMDEVVGQTPALFKSGAHDDQFYRQLWETVRAGRTFCAQVLNRRKDGSTYHAIKTITPMFDDQGRLVSFVNIDKDFSDQHAAQERLAQLALHDPLTGLANRALLEDHVRETVARGRREPTPCALLFIDLDGFKSVNDRQGHQAGDRVLQEVARRLRATSREMDIVARLGGDEFVLLLQGVGDHALAEGIAHKLLEAIQHPIDTGAGRVRVGASIGVAVHPRDGSHAQALLHHADQAMYRAKRAGGCRVQQAGTRAGTAVAPASAIGEPELS